MKQFRVKTVLASLAALSLLAGMAGGAKAQAIYTPPSTATLSSIGLKSTFVAVGLVPDAATDNTAAIQAALTAAGAAGGGKVQLPVGKFAVASALSVPVGVTLAGSGDYAASSSQSQFGAGGATVPGQAGTWLYITSTAGAQQANTAATEDTRTPTISCAEDAGVIGINMFWPNQNAAATGNPYAFPWAIKLTGNNGFVRDCQLLNPFQGIWCDNQRANVRCVDGQPLYLGMRVDNCADCCRWEDIHFNPFWSYSTGTVNTGVFTWECVNGIAFQMLRSDGHYASQCFCYGYNVGFQFGSSMTGSGQIGTTGSGANTRQVGATYGNFTACGADLCDLDAEIIQDQAPQGVHFVDPMFVATQTNTGGTGVLGYGFVTRPTFSGIASFVGGAVWGSSTEIGSLQGTGEVTFADMTFDAWATGNSAFGCNAGMTKIIGCTFRKSGTGGQASSVTPARVTFVDNVCKGSVLIGLANTGSGDVSANNTTY